MTAALAIARRFWWAVPIVGLIVALFLTRATLADRTATLRAERATWTATLMQAEAAKAKQEAGFAKNVADGAERYAARLAGREPIIVRSTNTVREYAQTDAGRVLCRGADRVRAIDALDAELAEPAVAARGGDDAVRADTPAPSGGR